MNGTMPAIRPNTKAIKRLWLDVEKVEKNTCNIPVKAA
jgi:hypothetical protein